MKKKNGFTFFLLLASAFLYAGCFGKDFSGVTNISSSLLKEGERFEFKNCKQSFQAIGGEPTTSLVLANDKLNAGSSSLDDSGEDLRAVQLFLGYDNFSDGMQVTDKSMYGFLVIGYGKYKLEINKIEPFNFNSKKLIFSIPAIVYNGNEKGEILITYKGKVEEHNYNDLWDETRNSKSAEEVKLLKIRMKARAELDSVKSAENTDDGYKYSKMLSDDVELGSARKDDYVFLTSLKDAVQIVFICSKDYGKTKKSCLEVYSENFRFENREPYSYWEWADNLIKMEMEKSERSEVIFDSHFNKNLTRYYVRFYHGEI